MPATHNRSHTEPLSSGQLGESFRQEDLKDVKSDVSRSLGATTAVSLPSIGILNRPQDEKPLVKVSPSVSVVLVASSKDGFCMPTSPVQALDRLCSLGVLLLHFSVALVLICASLGRNWLHGCVVHIPFMACYALTCCQWRPRQTHQWENGTARLLFHLIEVDTAVSLALTVLTTLNWHARGVARSSIYDAHVGDLKIAFNNSLNCWQTPLGCLSDNRAWSALPFVYALSSFVTSTWLFWNLLSNRKRGMCRRVALSIASIITLSLATGAVYAATAANWQLTLWASLNLAYCLMMFICPRYMAWKSSVWDNVGLAFFLGFVTTTVLTTRVGSQDTICGIYRMVGIILPVTLSNSLSWLLSRNYEPEQLLWKEEEQYDLSPHSQKIDAKWSEQDHPGIFI